MTNFYFTTAFSKSVLATWTKTIISVWDALFPPVTLEEWISPTFFEGEARTLPPPCLWKVNFPIQADSVNLFIKITDKNKKKFTT